MIFFKKRKPAYPEMQKINDEVIKITSDRLYLLELETRLIMEDAKSELTKQLQYDKEHIKSIVEDRVNQSDMEYDESKKLVRKFLASPLTSTKNVIGHILSKVKIK